MNNLYASFGVSNGAGPDAPVQAAGHTVDNNTAKIKVHAAKSKDAILAEIALLKERLSNAQKALDEFNQPHWIRHTGERLVVGDMHDEHLINAIRCILRGDERYALSPARLEQFTHVCFEAHDRGLAKHIFPHAGYGGEEL